MSCFHRLGPRASAFRKRPQGFVAARTVWRLREPDVCREFCGAHVRPGRSASARPIAWPSLLVGDRQDDDFAGVEAVVNGEGEAAKDASMRMRAAGPASRRLGDFFDGGTNDSQKIIAATSALLVIAIGTTEKLDLCGAKESDTGLDWHAWAGLSLTEPLGDLGLHIGPVDEFGATFVELLRSPRQLVIPGLVDRRLVVTLFEAAPQIIGDLLALVWFEFKCSIEDFFRAQHVLSLPRCSPQ